MRLYILLGIVAVSATLILTPAVRRLALGFNVLTPPRERDVHAIPIPRLGGMAMTGGFVLTLLVAHSIPFFRPAFETSPALWAVLAGSVAICLLGAIDDVWELDWMAKLGGQFLVAGSMATAGVQLINIPLFGVSIGSARLSILVSTFILVAVMNAVNFVDGLDGLAAGVIAIGSLAFFAYSYILARTTGEESYVTGAAVVTVALAGACLAFLWYNFHPASIFMGDSGAMVLGLVLGSAAIIVTGQLNPLLLHDHGAIATWMPMILPIAVLVIPLVDLVVTPAGRVLRGTSPATADRTHLHDRLLSRGHSHRGVVLILCAWTALACVVAVSLLLAPAKQVALWVSPFLALLILATASQFPGRERRRVGAGVPGGSVVMDDGQKVIDLGRKNLWFPLTGFGSAHTYLSGSNTKGEPDNRGVEASGGLAGEEPSTPLAGESDK